MRACDIFIGKARKFNQYSKGNTVSGNSCRSCVRKHFSYPYTCNDGWPLGDENWKDKGPDCINWTDNSRCQVD